MSAAAIVCWLCGFYVDGGIAAMNHRAVYEPLTIDGKTYDNIPKYDRAQVKNPYGFIAIGIEHRINVQWSAAVEFRHFSSLATTGDHGDDTISVSFHYTPYAR
jgi:hypothetical protein